MAPSGAPKKKPDVNELLDQLAQVESNFLKQEFLAPVQAGGVVRVRIGGITCRIQIEPADFVGWGVFHPVSHTEAMFVRHATLSERRRYLELFPLFRLIVCRRVDETWYGSAAMLGDSRLRIEGMAPILLAEELQLFDCVCVRYDGSQFWFDEHDARRDPGAAAYLRTALAERAPPDSLNRPKLTAEERAAYELNYWELVNPPAGENTGEQRRRPRQERASHDRDLVHRRLHESLSHAGAQLIDYLERADSYRVRYLIGGQRYTSSVSKKDLTVQVAGICLSGQDRKFDLASLVGVLREGNRGGDLVWVGDADVEETANWRRHRRRRRNR